MTSDPVVLGPVAIIGPRIFPHMVRVLLWRGHQLWTNYDWLEGNGLYNASPWGLKVEKER